MRAAGEPTRLRLLALLDKAELTVTDLVDILDQSQPRISRHLKLLVDAGLAQRFQEGAWAYFCTVDRGQARRFLDGILKPLANEDATLSADDAKLASVREVRAQKASSYFAANAEQWNKIRSLHVDENDVEKVMLEMGLGLNPDSVLDLGTGTGRILQLFAPHTRLGTGIDSSRDMLTLARSALSAPEFSHMQLRLGDVYECAGDETFDLVVLHQVLHYLEDPGAAILAAGQRLSPTGRLLIVDFAPHDFEFLRDEHAHHRLGISPVQIERWLEETGLNVVESKSLKPSDSAHDALTVMLWLAGAT